MLSFIAVVVVLYYRWIL